MLMTLPTGESKSNRKKQGVTVQYFLKNNIDLSKIYDIIIRVNAFIGRSIPQRTQQRMRRNGESLLCEGGGNAPVSTQGESLGKYLCAAVPVIGFKATNRSGTAVIRLCRVFSRRRLFVLYRINSKELIRCLSE